MSEKKTRIAIFIEGGVIQSVLADDPNIDFVTVDYDTEGVVLCETAKVTQSNGSQADAFVSIPNRVEHSEMLDHAWNAAMNAETSNG